MVEKVLAEMGVGDRPVIPVFNKMDQLAEPETFATRMAAPFDRAVFTSALTADVGQILDLFTEVVRTWAVEPSAHHRRSTTAPERPDAFGGS